MRSKKFRSTLITFGIVIAAFIACQVMISTGAMTRSLKGQLVPICNSCMVLSSLICQAYFCGYLEYRAGVVLTFSM